MSYTCFNPKNPTVAACVLSMRLTAQGKQPEANEILQQTFQQVTNPFEKFIAAFQIASLTSDDRSKCKWLEKALIYVQQAKDQNSDTALKQIYEQLSTAYKRLNVTTLAQKYYELAKQQSLLPNDPGPFYHGTRAELSVGDLLTAGKQSNYEADLKMNHIYFTSNLEGAILAASLAQGKGQERIYMVEPTGIFEHDPNVTDKKFPGNLTCSYRSTYPLEIVGEVTNYTKQSEDERKEWQENIAKHQGKIIN